MQNPPPTQPGYGAPTGNPPPSDTPKSGVGLEPNIAAALSYIWIVGVIFYLLEKENRFLRFHAMQSILFGIANTLIMMVLAVVALVLTFAFGIGGAMVGGTLGSIVSLLIWLMWMLFWILGLAIFAALIFTAVKAYQGQKFKLPIIGKMAENIVK
jgi:uncharacterized membrane protein